MISKTSCLAMALLFAALAAVPAQASSITVTIGNASSALTNGGSASASAATSAQAGSPAPFSAVCGSDIGANCIASWTFNYVVPVGELVTVANLTLGLVDIDSAAAGSQVNNYSITGGDNLTAAFNTAAESAASLNSKYNVFTLALTNFAVLNGGSATVNLALQGPGLGVLANQTTAFNGAYLIYSQLDLTTAADTGNPNPVPDPASTGMLLAASLGILVRARAKTRDR